MIYLMSYFMYCICGVVLITTDNFLCVYKNIDNKQIGILEQFHMDYVGLKTGIMAVEYSVLPSQNKMLINTLK